MPCSSPFFSVFEFLFVFVLSMRLYMYLYMYVFMKVKAQHKTYRSVRLKQRRAMPNRTVTSRHYQCRTSSRLMPRCSDQHPHWVFVKITTVALHPIRFKPVLVPIISRPPYWYQSQEFSLSWEIDDWCWPTDKRIARHLPFDQGTPLFYFSEAKIYAQLNYDMGGQGSTLLE